MMLTDTLYIYIFISHNQIYKGTEITTI